MVINFQKLKKQIVKNADNDANGNASDDAEHNAGHNVNASSCNASVPKKHNISHKQHSKKHFSQHGQQNKVKAPPFKQGQWSPLNWQHKIKNADLNAGLLEIKFCYGCNQFSIDYPDTDQEIAWCVRTLYDEQSNPTAGYHMVRIFSKHKVKQCPKVKKCLKCS